MKPTISEIIEALNNSWARDTSFSQDEWTESNLARGHCVVSVLVLQDIFGGEIKRYEVTGKNIQEKHFVNIIDGREVDSTKSQYKEDVVLEESPPNLKDYKNTREKLLSDKDTKKRYQILKERVVSYLVS